MEITKIVTHITIDENVNIAELINKLQTENIDNPFVYKISLTLAPKNYLSYFKINNFKDNKGNYVVDHIKFADLNDEYIALLDTDLVNEIYTENNVFKMLNYDTSFKNVKVLISNNQITLNMLDYVERFSGKFDLSDYIG